MPELDIELCRTQVVERVGSGDWAQGARRRRGRLVLRGAEPGPAGGRGPGDATGAPGLEPARLLDAVVTATARAEVAGAARASRPRAVVLRVAADGSGTATGPLAAGSSRLEEPAQTAGDAVGAGGALWMRCTSSPCGSRGQRGLSERDCGCRRCRVTERGAAQQRQRACRDRHRFPGRGRGPVSDRWGRSGGW